jgi:Ca2+-binding RTX toxin-like protein
MLRGRLGRRVARAGRQAGRTVAPGIAAALGTLAISNPSNAAAIIDTNTPSTAFPLSVPTNEIDIPAFIGSQFYAFEIPADAHSLEIGAVFSGNDPDLHAYLLLTAGDQLTRQVAVPLITVQPGSSTISGSTTIMQATTGAVTLSGGGSGAATLMGGADTVTLAGGPYLSFADFFINQLGGNFSVAGGGSSTITASGGNDTIFAGGGNATISAGGGNSTFFAAGGNPTIFADGGSPTISAGGGSPTFFAGGGTSPTVSGAPPQIPATILGGLNLSAFFDGDPPADDVIVGILLENSGASLNGGVITFSETVDPPAAAPEPATLGLLASALAGFAFLRRRRLWSRHSPHLSK